MSLTSLQHVSDRLSEGLDSCNEENIIYCGNVKGDFNSSKTTTRFHMKSGSSDSINCRQGSLYRHSFCETHQDNVKTSKKLPKNVLNLVAAPCLNDECNDCGIQSVNCKNDELNIFGIYVEVLKKLKLEVKTLIEINAGVPFNETPILGLIVNSFLGQDRCSSALDCPKDLLQYAKTLTVECVEIIERVILQQSDGVLEINHSSTKKKIKALLLKVMLEIEQELINSEKILETIDTGLHYPSFQFIYSLLKYFIEKIAAELEIHSSASNLSNQKAKVSMPVNEYSVELNSFIHPSCEHTIIPDRKIEEYSNRLDKLLKQWTGTGDSSCQIENPRQVVLDCFQCLTRNQNQDVFLETVTRFSEEIKRRLISCHQVDNRTHSKLRGNQAEASNVKESPSDTVCSTEMSTYYTWDMTDPDQSSYNRGRKNLSQCLNCPIPGKNVLTRRNECVCQICTRNSSSKVIGPISSLAHGCNVRSLSPPSHNNYCGKYLPKSGGNKSNRGMPTILSENNHCSKSPPAGSNIYHATPLLLHDDKDHHRYGDICSLADRTNNRNMPLSLGDASNNYRCMSPTMVLPPIPKFQLPNIDLCNTSCTQVSSRVPGYTSPSRQNQNQKKCYHGNQMIGNCGGGLVICENKPKLPFCERFPLFVGEGFYGHKHYTTPSAQLFNSFSVSPKYEDGGTVHGKRKEGQNNERKSQAPSGGEQKGLMTTKQRRSLSPFKGRRSLSPNDNRQERELVNEHENKKRKSLTRDNKRRDSYENKKDDKTKNGKSKRERSPAKDAIKRNKIENPSIDNSSAIDTYMNKNANSKDELEFDNNQTYKPVPDSSKPSKMKRTEPLSGGSVENDNNKEKTVGDDDVKNKYSSSSPNNKKQNDDHCTCCKCTKNDVNNDDSSVFPSPCHCKGLSNQDTNNCSNRPIYQFFANPVPVNCNCPKKSDTNKTPLEVEKSRDKMEPTANNISRKERYSQDAETQTGKKLGQSETHLPEISDSEPSTTAQITPAQSKYGQKPCIEKSESCTCTVIFSHSSSKHKSDSQNNDTQYSASKTDSKCKCPRDIEDIFQNFDDKYSKCVQEIKYRIREGLIPRFSGSDESFTVTREITITPTRSKSASKEDKMARDQPNQQLKFQASKDKFYSDDTYNSAKSHDHQMSRDLREDIEELRRLVTNTKVGHCPCCKCCKCEGSGSKVNEECLTNKVPEKTESGNDKPELSSRNTNQIQKNGSILKTGSDRNHLSKTEIGESEDSFSKKNDFNISKDQKILKPMAGGRSLGKYQQQLITKSDEGLTDSLPKDKGEQEKADGSVEENSYVVEPQVGESEDPITKKTDSIVSKDQKNVKPMAGGRSLGSTTTTTTTTITNQQQLITKSDEGLTDSLPKDKGEQEEADGSVEENSYIAEPQVRQTSGSRMRLSKISVSEGRLSTVISTESPDATKLKDKESDATTRNEVNPNTTNSYSNEVEKKFESDQDTMLVADNEFTVISRDAEEITDENKRLKLEVKKEDKSSEASLQNESQLWQNRNAVKKKSIKPKAERKSKNISYESESSSEKLQRKITLLFDDDADQHRKISSERQALNESREQLFIRRNDGKALVDNEKQNLSPTQDENKKNWNPFGGLFGIFGVKAEEAEPYDENDKYQVKIDEELEAKKPELGSSSKRDGEINVFDSDLSSCEAGNPCISSCSSCSTNDECKELFDSLPCDFHSEESVTAISSISEVIKATETELYVMIIESQPPVTPVTNSHDEIISLLLSVNNNGTNISANSVSLGEQFKATSRDHVSLSSNPERYVNIHNNRLNDSSSLPCFPVELISLHPSSDTTKIGCDTETSTEHIETDNTSEMEGTFAVNSFEQKEITEHKSSKQEEKKHRRPCRDQPMKKKRPSHSPKTYSTEQIVRRLDSRLSDENVKTIKNTENKEVQVMKWNAKVQTAGPRKFNRTDITREMEDKLAVYLGLERTAEQMELKVATMEEEVPSDVPLRDTQYKRKSNKGESNGSFEKN